MVAILSVAGTTAAKKRKKKAQAGTSWTLKSEDFKRGCSFANLHSDLRPSVETLLSRLGIGKKKKISWNVQTANPHYNILIQRDLQIYEIKKKKGILLAGTL